MAVIPVEGTILELETATPGTYAAVAQVTMVGSPEPTVTEVKKTILSSTVQEYRPGKIPDNGTVTFRIQYDPNNTVHQGLWTKLYAGTIANWQIKYADGMATAAKQAFAAFITAIKEVDKEAETEANVEADVTMRITGAITRTAGS